MRRLTIVSIARTMCRWMTTITACRTTFHRTGSMSSVLVLLFCNSLPFHCVSLAPSFRSPNALPALTKTQYYYKTHQSGTVSIPKRRGGRISVGPDENETHSYVTKVDTTNLGPRKHQKRHRDGNGEEGSDDMQGHMHPFFRTGKLLACLKIASLTFDCRKVLH